VTTLQNVVTVPTAAIQLGAPGSSTNGTPGSYVYVVNDKSTVMVRQITTGPTDGTMTAVYSGLTTGEHVVVDGADRLRDGLRVNVSTLDGKPVARAPGAGAPGRGAAGAGAPGTGAPGTAVPGTGAPGSEAPGSAAPARGTLGRHGGQSRSPSQSQNQRPNNSNGQ
jgi:multidrug efflux system membrane fusion protein